jgi:hypothetical protein
MFLFTWLASFVASALICSTGSFAAPTINGTHAAPPDLEALSPQARDILARATPAAPHWVVYGDAWDGQTGPPSVANIKVDHMSLLIICGV